MEKEEKEEKKNIHIPSFSSTEELYGIAPKELGQLNYKDALIYKVQGAKKILIELLEPHFMDRDTYKINKINKAIKFNLYLLKELEEKQEKEIKNDGNNTRTM